MRLLERLGRGSRAARRLRGWLRSSRCTSAAAGSGAGSRRRRPSLTAGSAEGAARPSTQLNAVKATLDIIRGKYVDPSRVKPRTMFLSALNQIQREVAQVIVQHQEKSNTVKVQVDTESKEFRVDNVQGPWDVAARLREVFAFLQVNLKDKDLDLRDVEYAACNGMLARSIRTACS